MISCSCTATFWSQHSCHPGPCSSSSIQTSCICRLFYPGFSQDGRYIDPLSLQYHVTIQLNYHSLPIKYLLMPGNPLHAPLPHQISSQHTSISSSRSSSTAAQVIGSCPFGSNQSGSYLFMFLFNFSFVCLLLWSILLLAFWLVTWCNKGWDQRNLCGNSWSNVF